MGFLLRTVTALSLLLAVAACTSVGTKPVDSNPVKSPTEKSMPATWPDFMPHLVPSISESPEAAAIPPDVSIKTPSGDTAKTRAVWSGVWSGWGGAGKPVELALAVEQISDDAASIVVVRTVANVPRLEHRVRALFDGDELVSTLPSGTVMRYRLRNANTIEFVWRSTNGGWMAGVLSRTNPASSMSKIRIPTTLTEDGTSVALEAVLYKPAGDGPFPTLVFNHGSTGDGNNPAAFTETSAEPNIGRWFTERGWMVVFPQRRGRGKSGGRYAEGLEADGSGYSIRPEISLPGVDRALTDIDAVVDWLGKQPEADTDRMLIGGQSRGGILAVAFAGTRPKVFSGAINFVGGWMGDGLPATQEINRTVFVRGAPSAVSTLWLYADQDPFYGLDHSRSNFDAFTAAGGMGEFHVLPVKPAQDGHGVISDSSLWSDLVDAFVNRTERAVQGQR